MSPGRLLQYFEQIAGAPDAVPRLRRFILDLAVRGKLVEQDPGDEPAAELIRRLEAERRRYVSEGTIKKIRDLPQVAADEPPFGLPKNWLWERFGKIAAIRSNLVRPQDYPDHPHIAPDNIESRTGKLLPFDSIRESDVSSAKHLFFPNHIIYSKIRPNLAKAAIVTFEGLCSADAYPILPLLDIQFLLKFMLSDAFVMQAVREDNRVAMPKINQDALNEILVAVPPLAEQHRIVAKVDELMALCDELEAAQAKRERQRDRLVAATLHGLNNGDASAEPGACPTLQNNARFYFNHLPRLTTRPEHIRQLRQTILNLAVRGRLVPQDPADGPVSMLLVEVAKGRERIINVLGLRQQPPLPEVRHVAPPFGAPDSWVWSLVDDCFVVTGGIQKTPKRTPRNNAFPYVGVANVYRGRLDLAEVKQFELNDGELEKLRLEANDLLIVEGNGSASEIGRCARWSGELSDCVHQNHIIRCRPGNPGISRFAELYLNSEIGVGVMRELAVTSAGLYNLSVGKIRKIQLPLPPLAEQHRIVAKVDELMALCEELEARLTTTATTRHQLLEATIHEVEQARVAGEAVTQRTRDESK